LRDPTFSRFDTIPACDRHTQTDRHIMKVTASNVHCKCGNASETVQDGVVVPTDH